MISKEEARRLEEKHKRETELLLGEIPGEHAAVTLESQRGKQRWLNRRAEEEEDETPLEDMIDEIGD